MTQTQTEHDAATKLERVEFCRRDLARAAQALSEARGEMNRATDAFDLALLDLYA